LLTVALSGGVVLLSAPPLRSLSEFLRWREKVSMWATGPERLLLVPYVVPLIFPLAYFLQFFNRLVGLTTK
jgi:hypothetical protein